MTQLKKKVLDFVLVTNTAKETVGIVFLIAIAKAFYNCFVFCISGWYQLMFFGKWR